MEEWYHIGLQTKPNMIGGYENQAFLDYKDDAFSETLTTDIADTITIYNSDLSESKTVRGIVQNNTADTQAKSLERTILFPIGTVKAGQYIYFNDSYWLVTGYPGNNKIYEKVTVVLCQYLLRWQNQKGEIIERWISFTSAFNSEVGEQGNNTITIASGDYSFFVGRDDETIILDEKRVFIDTNENLPVKVYKLTRNNDVSLHYYSHGSCLNFIAERDQLNTNRDNQELRLCDYFISSQSSNPDGTADENAPEKIIISGKDELKLGFPRVYSVTFINKDDKTIENVAFTWNVVSDFDIVKSVEGNCIELCVNDESCIGKSFTLQILINDEVSSEKEITVTYGY